MNIEIFNQIFPDEKSVIEYIINKKYTPAKFQRNFVENGEAQAQRIVKKNLTDGYCRSLLTRRGFKINEITPKMIEEKRTQVLMKRKNGKQFGDKTIIGAICPKCGGNKSCIIEDGRRNKCLNSSCFNKFSLGTGTIFKHLNISIRVALFQYVYYFLNPDFPAEKMSALAGVNIKTTTRIKKLVLPLITQIPHSNETDYLLRIADTLISKKV